MWDIYGERWNLSEDYGRDKFFLAIVKFHKCPGNVQAWTFSVRKMDYG